MDKKVSVVIPVYNVEKYLRRCVDSVLNQTYKNLEVVLIDDGSPDGSPQICDEYAASDSRVKVIHKKNGGLSSARNAALDSSLMGDYVTFIDSDDWIEKDYYEYCIKLIEETGADVAQIDFTFVTDTKQDKQNPEEKVDVYNGKEILQHYMTTTTTTTGSYSVCRCLFALHLTDGVRFRVGKTGEDQDWKYKVLSKAGKMVNSNQVKYYYYQTGNSLSTGALQQKHVDDGYESGTSLYTLTKDETYGTIRFLGEVRKARTPFSLLCRIAMFGAGDSIKDKKALIKKLTKEHRGNVKILLKAPLPISRKILTVLLAINYHCVSVPLKIIKLIKK